ncbi:zinc ribbon domain-containing protein [Clostridium sp. MCC353]|uniref:zinc ribbon domain-containing protein n=1 Tax=Clostridium sp. MCC353 TaxID=2592646 RepID=UPI001C031803|nr:zinc ribbon domain-containing protein [Clostridium sp. MCC353]
MKICRNCGNEMRDDELFCCECGTKAETEALAPEAVLQEEANPADVTGETEAAEPFAPSEDEGISEPLPSSGQSKAPAWEEPAANPPSEENYVTVKLDDPIFCPNCGMKNEPDGMFCQNCGAPLNESQPVELKKDPVPEETVNPVFEQPEQIFCPACGTQNDASDAFCQNCGANLHEEAPVPQGGPVPAKKKSKLPVIIGGIAAAAVVIGAAVFGISRFGGGSKDVPSITYVKDSGIYRYNVKSGKGLEVTSKGVGKNSEYYEVYYAVNQVIESKDGKYLFFLEDYSSSSGKLSYINQKKQSDKNDTTEKIDSDVSSFKITDDNKVVYKKGSSTVYIYDLKTDEKEKVGSNIYTYIVSEDGKTLLFITDENDMYYREIKPDADKEKLDSDVQFSYFYTEDLNTLYYTKDTDIYCIKNLKDKEKVASDANLLGSYNDGAGIFYSETTDPVVTIDDIVIDDLAASDAAMQQPLKENYTKQEQSWFGGTRTVTDYDRYNAAMDEYREKEARDEIRSKLETEVSSYLGDAENIYAYDGTEHELVKNAVSPEDIGYYDYIYYTYSWDEVTFPTMKMSEIESISDVTDFISKAYNDIGKDGIDGYLLIDGKALPFTYESDMNYVVDTETKTIFATSYTWDDETYGLTYHELFSMKYSDTGVEKAVSIDDDLGEDYVSRSPEGGKMYYYKDYDSEKNQGTLYCDGQEIDEDVFCFYYDEDSKDTYYLKEKSKTNSSGTLCRYDGKKPVKLIDDVAFFAPADDQYVAAIVDYSSKRHKGDLKLVSVKDGKKTKKIDEDVRWIKDGIGSYDLNY